MRVPLRIALVGDGPTDAALWPVVVWSLLDRFPGGLELQYAGFFPRSARSPRQLVDEVLVRVEPDLILFHRDAEREDPSIRRREVPLHDRVVPVIPVRMTEAWLLIDALAIAEAANNPGYRGLALPPISRLESLADPKVMFEELMLEAADLPSQRHKRRFKRDTGRHPCLVADYIRSYAPLRELPAFASFEDDLHRWVERWSGEAPSPPASTRPRQRR